MVFPNTYSKITRLLRAMVEAGVKAELECFDSGHTNGIAPLMDMGLLREPLQFSFIVNVLGGIPPTSRRCSSALARPARLAVGSDRDQAHCQWKMEAAALVLGGNVRVGLEDHFYLPDGTMAKSNGELVEKVVQMARLVGRQPATVEEARKILGLDKFAPAAVAR